MKIILFLILMKFVQDLTFIPTKRNIIKAIASIYDPLGLLNPNVVQMKTIFQKLCSPKYD